MSESKNNNAVAIWVAVIGLLGILATSVFNNWDKIFPEKDTAEVPVPETQPAAADQRDAPKEQPDRRELYSPKPATSDPGRSSNPSISVSEKTTDTFVADEVTGKVVDQDEKAVEGIEVRCVNCPGTPIVRTDSDGQFRLPFRVNNVEEITLSIKGYPHVFRVRVNDPHDRFFKIYR